MGLQEAIKTVKSLKSLRWFEYAGDRGRKILSSEEDEAIDTVLAELDRLQIENKEKEEIIKDMQDELKHIPSIVSETM